MSGSASSVINTDASGNYSFTVNEGGNYTVTPSLANNTFTPASQTFNILSGNQTADFIALPVTYNIGGNIQSSGTNLQGATVSLTGSQSGTTTTDANGNYAFIANEGGNYTVTPVKTEYFFAPSNRTINNLQGNQAAVNFAATASANGVAFWRGESNANDSIGTNHGTLVGGANYGTGIVGQAFSFDGVLNTSVEVPSSTAVSRAPTAPLTINLWAYRTDSQDEVHFVGKRECGAATFNYQMGIHTGVGLGLFFGSSNGYASTGNDPIPVNQWTMVTGTFDGSALRIYKDGVLLATRTGITLGPENTTPFKIGTTGTCYRGWRGRLDEVKIYDRALSQTEIQGLYNQDTSSFIISGSITRGGGILSGTQVNLTGEATQTATTDQNGNYSFVVTRGNNYTVTPVLAGSAFTPASQTFNNVTANQTANFAASAANFNIGGNVQSGGTNLAGATVSLSGSSSGTTTTDANGNYTFSVAAGGSYTVAASLNGYLFNPANRSFTNVQSNRMGNFAAGEPTGGLDAGFDANLTDGKVSSVISMTQPDGKILIGGGFSLVGATERQTLARLNADGTLDNSFNSGGIGPNSTVYDIIVLLDGKILIGGVFTTYNGVTTGGLTRLNSDGTLDTTFNAGGSGSDGNRVYGLKVQPDGKILIGGGFLTYNGAARQNVARLNADGTLDAGFVPQTTANAGAEFFDVQPNGKVLVAGGIGIGGTKYPVARLNADGSLDNSFALNTADNIGYSVKVQTDGKIILTGFFNSYGNQTRRNAVRLNSDGTIDAAFSPSFVGWGYAAAIARQSNGKIVAAGNFETANGSPRSNVARFNADGTLDATFTTGAGTFPDPANSSNIVNSAAVQTDGKIVIAGGFGGYAGATRRSIARLSVNGTLDTSFNATDINGASSSNLTDFVILPNGKFLTGGVVVLSGVTKVVLRLNADGSLDSSTLPQPNSGIVRMISQPDGKVLVGGNFTTWGGQSRNRIARLNSDGTLDTTFLPGTGANAQVASLAVQPDGKILIGGSFTTYNGATRKTIARLNSDGSLDASFDAGNSTNTFVETISVQTDGKIIIGGRFSTVNVETSNRLARLNSDGTLDPTFVSGFDGDARFFVHRTLIQPDGKVVAGGIFKAYNGAARFGLARINAVPNYTISGQITQSNTALSGISVALSGSATATTTSDSNGNYSFAVAAGGDYTVTPTLANNTFSPASQRLMRLRQIRRRILRRCS